MDQKRSDYEIDERAAEAKALLEHPLLQEAVNNIHRGAVAALISSGIGSQEAVMAQAMLQAIQAIHGHLEGMITDKKVNEKYSRERKNV